MPAKRAAQHTQPAAMSKQPLRLTVHVTPRAKRNEIAHDGDSLRIWLLAAPVDGAANEALIALLAKRLRLPKRALEIVRGATCREKVVEVTGLTMKEFWHHLGLQEEK